MFKRFLLISIAFLIAVFYIAGSNSYAAATPSDQLNELLASFKVMTAHFTEIVVDQNGNELQQGAGVLTISKPGKFYWHTEQPSKQTIIANGARIWIYDPPLMQVTVKSFNKAAGATPAALLSGKEGALRQHFAVSALQSDNGELAFMLKPKDKDSLLHSVVLSFTANKIHTMVLRDHLGQKTKIIFTKVNTEIKPDLKLFEFVVPKDVDVIDETL